MNINFLNIAPQISKINNIKSFKPVTFCGLKPLQNDVFQKQDFIKKVEIEDSKGNKVEAEIKEAEADFADAFSTKDPKRFVINVDGKKLGCADIYNSRDSVYLKWLSTEENATRHYKGAGTELLKCVAEESKKRGFNGRVTVSASHVPPPFAFYYKNNFQVDGPAAYYNGAIDYSVRKDVPVWKVMPSHQTALSMLLTEEGADALLEDKRLYEKRENKVLLEKQVKNSKLQASMLKGLYDQYYFQVIDENAKEKKQKYAAIATKERDFDDVERLKLFNVDDCYATEYIRKEFVQEAIDIMAKELGLDGAYISDEYLVN